MAIEGHANDYASVVAVGCFRDVCLGYLGPAECADVDVASLRLVYELMKVEHVILFYFGHLVWLLSYEVEA